MIVAGAWLYDSAVVTAGALAQGETAVCAMNGTAPLGSVAWKYSLIEVEVTAASHVEARVDDMTIHNVMRVAR